MKPLPLPLRLAAGLAVSARDRAKELPRQIAGMPVTVASQLLQASMRLQQQVTELAIKGDEALSGLQPVEEKPSWATFDEDEELPGEPFAPAKPLANGFAAHRSLFEQARADEPADEDEASAATEPADEPAPPRAAEPPEWLPNYPELSLPQLRARLRQFDPHQLGELLAYEEATANREDFAGMLRRRIERIAGSADTAS